MCGEIQDWQESKTVTVRLTATGLRNVFLTNKFDRVEEVRVEEILVTGVGGSGASYLRFEHQNLTDGSAKSEPVPGLMVCIDVLNPHVVYSRPRVIARGDRVSINNFQIGLFTPAGAALGFTEASIVLTFVCRRSEDSLQQIRMLKAAMDYPPSIKDFARNTYEP